MVKTLTDGQHADGWSKTRWKQKLTQNTLHVTSSTTYHCLPPQPIKCPVGAIRSLDQFQVAITAHSILHLQLPYNQSSTCNCPIFDQSTRRRTSRPSCCPHSSRRRPRCRTPRTPRPRPRKCCRCRRRAARERGHRGPRPVWGRGVAIRGKARRAENKKCGKIQSEKAERYSQMKIMKIKTWTIHKNKICKTRRLNDYTHRSIKTNLYQEVRQGDRSRGVVNEMYTLSVIWRIKWMSFILRLLYNVYDVFYITSFI